MRIPNDTTKTDTYNWLKLPNKYKWDEKQATIFKETLYSKKIEKIVTETEELLLVKSNSKENTINSKNNKYKKKKKKKWYDTECKNVKNTIKRSAKETSQSVK